MSGNTPLESPRTARTPPSSARGFNSARGNPTTSNISVAARIPQSARGTATPMSARGNNPIPRTPRTASTDSTTVQVLIRAKPVNISSGEATEAGAGAFIAYTAERAHSAGTPSSLTNPNTLLTLIGPATDGSGTDEQREYEFSEVFEANAPDTAVNNSVVPAVIEQVRSGVNACVLLYGQTGSGKTHTMSHLTHALLDSIFSFIAESASDDADGGRGATTTMIVEMSYLQVYNNTVFNLLGSKGRTCGEFGEVLPRPKGHLISEPSCIVTSALDVKQKLSEAQKRRVISTHCMNPRSSRSHTLFSLRICKCVDGTPVQASKITLVDLAGCERVKKSGVAGEGLDEAIAINKSLSALHGVIKAISTEADVVVPFRESLLTLYLKPAIMDSYLLLITTISLEAASFSETKSTLDFATTAKKCVVSRVRSATADRLVRNGTIEATYLQLQHEIETLRNRVEVLTKSADLDKSKKQRLENQQPSGAAQSPEKGIAIDLLRDQIVRIEQQCASFQSLLRDREEELVMLESRRALADDIRKEIEQRQMERDETRAVLATMGGAVSSASLLQGTAALDKLQESFLWIEEQFNAAMESNTVLERQLDSLRQDHRRVVSDFLIGRKTIMDWEARFGEVAQSLEEISNENMELRRKYDEIDLHMHRERNDRMIREDTIALYNATNSRAVDLEKLRQALDEQRALCDVIQSRLSSAERELDHSESSRMKLEESVRAKDDTLRSLFSLLTPQQKARLMQHDIGSSSSASSSAAVSGSMPASSESAYAVQSFDVVQLRAQLRDFQRQNSDLLLKIKEKDFHIEDLESEKQHMEELYRNRNDDYSTLLKLDEQHNERQEQLEEQLTDLYAYVEAHAARQQHYESRMTEARTEWEKLDEEYKQAQRIINELTTKLDRACEDLKLRDADKDLLTARLKEAEAEKSTIARMRADDRARLSEMERQLQMQQTHSTDVARRLDIAEKGRQHLATEIQHHNTHGDVLQRKLVSLKLPPETLKKHFQKLRHVDPSVIFSAAMAPAGGATNTAEKMAEAITRQNKVTRHRFEVSQLLKGGGMLVKDGRKNSSEYAYELEGNSREGGGSTSTNNNQSSSPVATGPAVPLMSNPVVPNNGGIRSNVPRLVVPQLPISRKHSTSGGGGNGGAAYPPPPPVVDVASRTKVHVDIPTFATILAQRQKQQHQNGNNAAAAAPIPQQQLSVQQQAVALTIGKNQETAGSQSPPMQQQQPQRVKPEIPKLSIAPAPNYTAPPQRRSM